MRKGKKAVTIICIIMIVILIVGIITALSLSRSDVSVDVSGDVSGENSGDLNISAISVSVADKSPSSNNPYIDYKGPYYSMRQGERESFNIKLYDSDGKVVSYSDFNSYIKVELRSTGDLDAQLVYVDGYYRNIEDMEVTSYYFGETTRSLYDGALVPVQSSNKFFDLQLDPIKCENIVYEDVGYSFTQCIFTEAIYWDYRKSFDVNFEEDLSYFYNLSLMNGKNIGHIYYLITVETSLGLSYQFAIDPI